MDSNRSEHDHNGFDSLFSSSGSYDLSHYQATKPGIFKAPTMNTIITFIGVPTYLWALFANIQNWKGDLLFLFGVMFWLFKFIRLIVRMVQETQEKNIELRAKRKRWDKENAE
jgi:hypothetical protein